MRYLITGVAGFLGSNLAHRLISQGHTVIGVDNLHSGSQSNVDWLLRSNLFSFVAHDVVNAYDIACDVVCNLSCPASPSHYQIDPIYTTKIAFIGTLNALENAARHKAIMLQASTSEIYGDPVVHPQSESYFGNVNPVGPRSCYDEGKRIGETLCNDFTRQGLVDARIVRIFNTYGPRMRSNDGRVVSNFILQAIKGKPLSIYGDGTQTRSFCFVDDLIDGLIKMIEHPVNPGVVNLGNPQEFTVLQLAQEVLRHTGLKSDLVFYPLPIDDPRQRRPDISKANSILNWNPNVSLRKGLGLTIKYFAQYLKP